MKDSFKFMKRLKGFQRKHLKGLAHKLKPVVLIGQNGLTAPVKSSIQESLDAHELIKIRFIDFKEKAQKDKIARAIEETTQSEIVGSIGHVYIFYRQNRNPKKRAVLIPERSVEIMPPKKKKFYPESK